jgi:methyltransferase (TIGR00027 family)
MTQSPDHTSTDQLGHVSDTALLVAAARAMETERADGVVHDPIAAHLAGPRGMTLAHGVPGRDWLMFGVGMRCRFIDGFLHQTLSGGGVNTVASLGAGLDTRPWRLDLPVDLHWIEADFAAILDYKTERLASQPTACRLQRVAADLNNPASREEIFRVAGSAPGVMITEGLLMYLPPQTVEALAAEALVKSGIRYWILDVASQDLMRRAHQDWQGIQNLRPEGYLKGVEILDMARRHGWSLLAQRTYTRDAWDTAVPSRIHALPGETMIDDRGVPSGGDPSGAYLFGR